MPVKKDEQGRRSVEAQVEIPGTPEQVWAAIATGPGMSAWFVPSTCEERVGGSATNNFGPGMESVATIREWEPPHKLVAETEEGPGVVATEWIVEARDGGMCVVRVVHRWFAQTDKWDNEFEGHTHGWRAFFRILSLYMTHFRGQQSVSFHHTAICDLTPEQVRHEVADSLGLESDNAHTSQTPRPAASIVHQGEGEHAELVLRLHDEPQGLAHIFGMPMDGRTMISFRCFLYGDQVADRAEEIRTQWASWLKRQFPEASNA